MPRKFKTIYQSFILGRNEYYSMPLDYYEVGFKLLNKYWIGRFKAIKRSK